jgi:hypothetical protein
MKKFILFLAVCSLCRAAVVYATDQTALDQAIKALNAQGQTEANKKFVLNAVSQQTNVPEKTLQKDMTATGLNYGELLTAESLSQASGKNLNAVLAMKRGKGWADVSREFRIDPNSIVNRLRSAEKLAQAGLSNKKQQAGNMKKPTDRNAVQAPQPTPARMGGY